MDRCDDPIPGGDLAGYEGRCVWLVLRMRAGKRGYAATRVVKNRRDLRLRADEYDALRLWLPSSLEQPVASPDIDGLSSRNAVSGKRSLTEKLEELAKERDDARRASDRRYRAAMARAA